MLLSNTLHIVSEYAVLAMVSSNAVLTSGNGRRLEVVAEVCMMSGNAYEGVEMKVDVVCSGIRMRSGRRTRKPFISS